MILGVMSMYVIGFQKHCAWWVGGCCVLCPVFWGIFFNFHNFQSPLTTEPTSYFQIVEFLLKNVTQRLLDSSEEDITWHLKNVATENHAVCSLLNLISFCQLSLLVFYIVATHGKLL